jgi:hypothetical protein
VAHGIREVAQFVRSWVGQAGIRLVGRCNQKNCQCYCTCRIYRIECGEPWSRIERMGRHGANSRALPQTIGICEYAHICVDRVICLCGPHEAFAWSDRAERDRERSSGARQGAIERSEAGSDRAERGRERASRARQGSSEQSEAGIDRAERGRDRSSGTPRRPNSDSGETQESP